MGSSLRELTGPKQVRQGSPRTCEPTHLQTESEGSDIPEGPEVRRIKDKLHFLLVDPREANWSGGLRPAVGLFIKFAGRYANDKFPKGFTDVARGGAIRIEEIGSKGKFLWWRIAQGAGTRWLHCTLGMTGTWRGGVGLNDPDLVARFGYSRDGEEWHTDGSVSFVDQRRFGTLKFVDNEEEHDKKLASLGPDMLVDPPDGQTFIDRFRRKDKKTVAEVLMDQSVVSGVGNYLKAESLYLAKLSPNRLVRDCEDYELEDLWVHVQLCIENAYKHRGATLIEPEGNVQNRRRRVYGHKTDHWGREVIQEKTRDGRTTWWCPEVQS